METDSSRCQDRDSVCPDSLLPQTGREPILLQTITEVAGAVFDQSSLNPILLLRERLNQRILTKDVDHAGIALGMQEYSAGGGLGEYLSGCAGHLQTMSDVVGGFCLSQWTNMIIMRNSMS